MKKTLKWLAVILWMALIFVLSSQPATVSNNQSTKMTQKIAQITVQDFFQKPPNEQIKIVSALNPVIRKCAHTFLFAVLAILLLYAFLSHVRGPYASSLYSAAVVFLYAVFDEFHQHFISGRGPQAVDVLLDTVSGIAALLLFGAMIRWMSKRKKSKV